MGLISTFAAVFRTRYTAESIAGGARGAGRAVRSRRSSKTQLLDTLANGYLENKSLQSLAHAGRAADRPMGCTGCERTARRSVRARAPMLSSGFLKSLSPCTTRRGQR